MKLQNIKTVFIRKRNDNYNVYIEYINEEGKLKQKSQAKYSNKKDAEKHLTDLKSSINNNKFIISKDITLVDRCYKYIDDNTPDWSPYTIVNRKSWVKNQILPFFGDTMLQDVSIYQLQQFINSLYKKYTVESSQVRFGFLRAVLKESYRLREINENPTDFVKYPSKERECVTDVYTREEAIKLVNSIDGHCIEIPILLMILLGLRHSEAIGLTWDDIDFTGNTVSVNKILIYEGNQGFTFKKPKTRKSIRTLHAPKEIMIKLKKEKLRQNELKLQGVLENDLDLVCLNMNLKPWLNTTLRFNFSKFLKSINLRKIRIHDLRHTNATLMLLSGTNIKVVSERLGHTDIKISMNRYSHVLEEMDKEASNNLSQIIFK